MYGDLKIFGVGDSKDYATEVARYIGTRLSLHEENYFDDGECYIRSEENVRGKDVFVICSLYNSVKERLADKFIKLLFFTNSLRDASAGRITLVFPYLSYQRQDRKNKSRAPIYTKYVPMILESARCDRLLALDPHNLSAFQSGNRVVNDHIEAKGSLTDALAKQIQIDRLDPSAIVALSPDEGGVKRARFSRDALAAKLGIGVDIAYVDKTHENDGTIEANSIIGDVSGKKVMIFDDMLSSVKTMCEATVAVEEAGGEVYAACATHGLCVGKAEENIQFLLNKGIKVMITDSVEPLRLSGDTKKQVTTISTASLIGEAIRRIHNEESVSNLIG